MKTKIFITICVKNGHIVMDGLNAFQSDKKANAFAAQFDNSVVVEREVDIKLPKKAKKPKAVPVKVTCYNQTETYPSAKAAIDFYQECANCSDGCERERYLTIVSKLLDGQTEVDDQWD